MDSKPWFTTYQALAGVAVIFLAIYQVVPLALFSNLRKIPGPWYANWTYLWLKWHVVRGQRSQYIDSLHNRYGQFVRISPTEVAISNLEAYKSIHRVGSGFNKSEWYQKLNPGPPGVFAMIEPRQHAARRRLFAQAFSNSSIQLCEPVIRDRVSLAVTKIKRDALASKADILKWFTFMATDVSGELSFGKSFDMLQQEKKSDYIHDLEMILMISGISVELGPLVRLVKFLPIPSLQHAFSVGPRLDEYGHQSIQNLRNHVMKDGTSARSNISIFTKMVDKEKNPEISDEEIEHEASNLIVAGSDTTAISLTYTIWALLRSKNRSHRDKMLRELDQLSPAPTSAELSSLPYMNSVIKEGLRLYGAAPGSLPRVVPRGGTVFGDYALPEGVTVSTQAYTLHRDPENFPDPEKFEPGRWLNPTKTMLDAFAAFGTGSRTCLGIHLAMLELQLGVYTFFKECPQAELSPTTTDESMEFVNHFLIAPKGGKCEIEM